MSHTKTAPWTIVAMLVATSIFGQEIAAGCSDNSCKPKNCPAPCPQPCPPTQLCPKAPDPCCPAWPVPVLNAAYNYPARTLARCPWDVFVDVSFIYWQPTQDNMEYGAINSTVSTTTPGVGVNASMVNMSFDYKPGFKVGLGWAIDYDNWDMHAEYTWFHNTQNSTTTATANVIFPTIGAPGDSEDFGFFGGSNSFSSASEQWKLSMDIVDLDLGRWYYVGTKLTVRPDFGLRAAWIRQNRNTVYKNTTGEPDFTFVDTATIKEKTHSWGIGPKFEVMSNWTVGSGFRFFGNAETDLLYTRYTTISFDETHTGAGYLPYAVSQSSLGTVRTHLDLGLGIGWGTYWDCNKWYTDVALGYEFQAFYNQNMFRRPTDDIMVLASEINNGTLYVQGLTATFRLDF